MIPVSTNVLDMKIKGLSCDPKEFHDQARHTRQLLQLFNWKQKHNTLPVLIVLMGGTGTGKSTLFNALVKKKISAESVRRPTTSGGVAYIHEQAIDSFQDPEFPFITSFQAEKQCPCPGRNNQLTLVSHTQSLKSPIFIDSPDVDSICLENKNHAHNLLLLADIILFITSAEKYADQEPLEIINQAQKIGKQLFIILNKSDDSQLAKSIAHQLIKVIGFKVPFFSVSRQFKSNIIDFQTNVGTIRQYIETHDSINKIKKQDILALSRYYNAWLTTMEQKLSIEIEKSKEIEIVLQDALQTAKDLLTQSPAIFDRSYFDKCIKPHIKEVYTRHDLLAPIRQWILETIKKPFVLVSKSATVTKVDRFTPEMDLTPIFAALSEYQLIVKRHISSETFLHYVHDNKPEPDETTVARLFNEKMVAINRWLTGQFEKLNQGIPIQKRIGMHALSLTWGAAILGIESVSGGGLTPVELALDSILAPYITAGATELFVVNELKTIIFHLRNQYIKALYAIIDYQHRNYMNILEKLKPVPARPKNGLIIL